MTTGTPGVTSAMPSASTYSRINTRRYPSLAIVANQRPRTPWSRAISLIPSRRVWPTVGKYSFAIHEVQVNRGARRVFLYLLVLVVPAAVRAQVDRLPSQQLSALQVTVAQPGAHAPAEHAIDYR